MRKIHDIKIRTNRKKPIAVSYENRDGYDDGFWHGSENFEKKPILSDKLKMAIARGSIAVAILTSLLAFSLARAFDAKSKVEILVENTKIYLDNAFSSLNKGEIDQALSEAEKARANISEIKLNLQSWGQDLSYLSLISNKHSDTVNLEMTLDAANIILNTLTDSQKSLEAIISEEFAKDKKDKNVNFAVDIAAVSEAFSKTISDSSDRLSDCEKILNRINLGQLGSFKNSIEKARAAISSAKKSIESSQKLVSTDLPWISAKDGQKRDFLIIFQNNAELRGGSGGSFGSFGVAHFENGKFNGIDFGTNIYKIDHAFEATTKIAPPDDLSWVVRDGTWALKDSGWAVDGPEAFEKIKWFYEAETGQKIDGVFELDTSAFVDILRLIGPVDLPAYEKIIDANNFEMETEKEVHQDYFNKSGALEENEPKKMLADMMPAVVDRLISKLSDKTEIVNLFKTFSDSFSQKHMMFYAFDKDIEADLEKYNIAGKVLNTGNDYLYVNNSNLNGFKSSSNILENLSLDSTIGSDGIVNNSLIINRIHNGSNEWPDGYNINLLRVLLPANSKVTNFDPVVGNFEQNSNSGYKNGQPYWASEEAGNPEMVFWINTKPKEESKATINYSFPINNFDQNGLIYSAVFQRQPGANADRITYTLHFPENLVPINLQEYNAETNSATFNFDLISDKNISIKLQRK
ncbi:MAG: DUF4012 domain-containing protein [Patescibacteria group bacterium]